MIDEHARSDDDCRFDPVTWDAGDPGRGSRWRATALAVASTVGLALYFWWLLRPGRIGNPVLFGVLITAELFNVVQALGFWWTCLGRRPRRVASGPWRSAPSMSTCSSRPTASRSMSSRPRSPRRRGCGGPGCTSRCSTTATARRWPSSPHRHGVRYVRRTLHVGAKAGNINHALGRTRSPFVLVLDCDHVPHPDLLARTLPEFVDDAVAFVQTPQYYANAPYNRIAEASWRQQALFFGPIARGKDSHGSMFCCGTNVIFRREALAAVGGFPTGSLTEDFALSVDLHERGWRSAYVPEVLASGLGPEDMASYVSQQHRWARGCLGMIPRVLRSTLPLREEGAVPAVGVVLPVRLDRARVPVDAGRADPHRRPAARRCRCRQLPRRVRPVLRAVAGDGGERRRGLLHVLGVLARDVDVLDPHRRDLSRGREAHRVVRRHAEGRRQRPPVPPGDADARRDRGPRRRRAVRTRSRPRRRDARTTSRSPRSTCRSSDTASPQPSRRDGRRPRSRRPTARTEAAAADVA